MWELAQEYFKFETIYHFFSSAEFREHFFRQHSFIDVVIAPLMGGNPNALSPSIPSSMSVFFTAQNQLFYSSV